MDGAPYPIGRLSPANIPDASQRAGIAKQYEKNVAFSSPARLRACSPRCGSGECHAPKNPENGMWLDMQHGN